MKNTTIDLESCFDPVFEPPKSFLDACKRDWENFCDEIMKAKSAVPMFYAQDETGTLYFYHGKSCIRVSEHFAEEGKPIGNLIEDIIRYSANQKLEQSQAG